MRTPSSSSWRSTSSWLGGVLFIVTGSRTGLRPIYLPAWVLATSPLVGLTPAQQNLFIALTLELTRDTRRNGRPGQAAVITGGLKDICPLLGVGPEYVGFNGNGAAGRARLRRHGYKLAAWLKKAAYPSGATPGDLLADFAAITEMFGLVVAGYCPSEGAWLNLEELRAAARTQTGRKRLAGCLVRVYTAAAYLTRWRALFARRLGFAHIPKDAAERLGAGPVAVPDSPKAVTTARELAAWMRREGLTDGQLAERLGVSRPCVAQYRSGKRTMGKAFLTKLACYTSHSATVGCNALVTSCGAGVTVSSLGVGTAPCENTRNPGV